MRPFAYDRAGDLAVAARCRTAQGQTDAQVQFLAGGTTLIDLMKLDVLRPERVVDLMPLKSGHSEIEATAQGLRLGAFASMASVEDHPQVKLGCPAVAQSLALAASPQIRNMATLGGNVLQRTRCSYYRDPSWSECNKRRPGSGCAAIKGFNRQHAVLGVDDQCIAQYPGDFGVVLAAFAADVELAGPGGVRRIPFQALHRPAGQPHLEHTLQPGEVITAFRIPGGPVARRSLYLKVRDRQSYEFAIASAAVGLELDGGVVRAARIGLGGLAYRPWRSQAAEAVLIGKPLSEETAQAAAQVALSGAVTHGHNDYKPELGRRTLARALMQAGTMEA
ncbi:MAG: xanthine dehydrogenase family protein subunit M [Caulobacteraceae bacterium]|nr:xanthine dehydrogenase family protein subunit M [Caulobacteraceae bacterium]